jgi:hypothetical protein
LVHGHVERWSSGETSIERFQVGVNVAQQQYTHGSPGKLPIIAEFQICVSSG